MVIRIGYQGLEGSNAEAAAKIIIEKLNFTDVQYYPLISSKNVIGELKRNRIDYAVVAIKNSTAGVVEETFNAIKNEYLELVATEILPIHHCLFKKNEGIKDDEINLIVSHIQALKQTKNNIDLLFPGIKAEEIEDTAIGAKKLSEGIFDERTAVICRKNAGELFGLTLMKENIEDCSNNETEFRMFKLSDFNNNNNSDATLKDKIIYNSINDKGLGYITKSIIVISIFIAFYVQELLQWSYYDASVKIGGIITFIFLFLTSNELKNWVRYRTIKGYWKYYSIAENASKEEIDQKYETPRIVEIDQIDGELVFKGWICDKENILLFKSTKTIISPLGKRTGDLVYWYSNPLEINRGYNLKGIVVLNWETKNPAVKIDKMSGWYMGAATKEIGSLEYTRISTKEFETLRSSDYL